jgi:prophage antirepressor-like protein
MSNIIPFQFESHEVRTVVGEDGNVWFVGKDVAKALGYTDTVNAIKQHCDGVVKHHPIVDALGRSQEARIINEPDVYRLVTHSQLPEAQRFEKWVFEEVLPSIRKTGHYEAPKPKRKSTPTLTQTTNALLQIGRAVASVPGADKALAMSLALDVIEQAIEYPVTTLRKALPSATLEDAATLNATELGKTLGLTARGANQVLEEVGLQVRQDKAWRLTEAGTVYGEMKPFHHHGHSDYQILWKPSTTTRIRLFLDAEESPCHCC